MMHVQARVNQDIGPRAGGWIEPRVPDGCMPCHIAKPNTQT
jgi:hypothetical protein